MINYCCRKFHEEGVQRQYETGTWLSLKDQQRCSEKTVIKLRLERWEVLNSVEVGVWRYLRGRRAFHVEDSANESLREEFYGELQEGQCGWNVKSEMEESHEKTRKGKVM